MKNKISNLNLLPSLVGIASFLLVLTLTKPINLLTRFFNEGSTVLAVFIIVALAFSSISYFLLVFNPLVRKFIWFKPYFMSRYNFMSGKFNYEQKFNFSREILFEKFLEVLPKAGFEIIQSNLKEGTIFALSPISWTSSWGASWGENVYIQLREEADKSLLHFCSASVIGNGASSWGKNKHNYKKLLEEFEESLVI